MSYDEALAARIREVLAAEADITEQRMFGGLAFLAGGHIAAHATRDGGVLVKAPPDEHERLLRAGARPFEMGGRTMRGWLLVDGDRVRTRRQLTTWVERSLALARAEPPRRPRAPRKR